MRLACCSNPRGNTRRCCRSIAVLCQVKLGHKAPRRHSETRRGRPVPRSIRRLRHLFSSPHNLRILFQLTSTQYTHHFKQQPQPNMLPPTTTRTTTKAIQRFGSCRSLFNNSTHETQQQLLSSICCGPLRFLLYAPHLDVSSALFGRLEIIEQIHGEIAAHISTTPKLTR